MSCDLMDEDQLRNNMNMIGYRELVNTREEVTKLKKVIEIYKEANEQISNDTIEVGFYVEPTWSAQIANEAQKAVEELLK